MLALHGSAARDSLVSEGILQPTPRHLLVAFALPSCTLLAEHLPSVSTLLALQSALTNRSIKCDAAAGVAIQQLCHGQQGHAGAAPITAGCSLHHRPPLPSPSQLLCPQLSDERPGVASLAGRCCCNGPCSPCSWAWPLPAPLPAVLAVERCSCWRWARWACLPAGVSPSAQTGQNHSPAGSKGGADWAAAKRTGRSHSGM